MNEHSASRNGSDCRSEKAAYTANLNSASVVIGGASLAGILTAAELLRGANVQDIAILESSDTLPTSKLST
ncbi:hypothetical protein LTS18_012092, partial [Coniosporium uncinatum]